MRRICGLAVAMQGNGGTAVVIDHISAGPRRRHVVLNTCSPNIRATEEDE